MDPIQIISKMLQKISNERKAKKLTDAAHVAAECPRCKTIVQVHRMRAKYGHEQCPNCGMWFMVRQ